MDADQNTPAEKGGDTGSTAGGTTDDTSSQGTQAPATGATPDPVTEDAAQGRAAGAVNETTTPPVSAEEGRSADAARLATMLSKVQSTPGVVTVPSGPEQRLRHNISLGVNYFHEEYDHGDGRGTRDTTVYWNVKSMWLVNLTARPHHARRSGKDMLAVQLDVLVDGEIGYLPDIDPTNPDAPREPIIHSIFTKSALAPLRHTQLRLRGQQFVQFSHADELMELSIDFRKNGGSVLIKPEPPADTKRKTRDLLRCYATDPVRRTGLELTDFELVINPYFAIDEDTGQPRKPFVSIINGLDDQALRFMNEPRVRTVTFINGMTQLPNGSLVPMSADIGVVATNERPFRLYGAKAVPEEDIRALFSEIMPDLVAEVGVVDASDAVPQRMDAAAVTAGEGQQQPAAPTGGPGEPAF